MTPTWLTRLERPTTYPELHALFEEMTQAAEAPTDRSLLAEQLEEAIRCIGRESVHDQRIYDEYEAAYEAFQEKESGVVGWLRRHLPFTETRQKDKAHRADLRSQQAELLGNLATIARIRLLRAALLSEDERPVGAPAGVWQSRLGPLAADGDLVALADGLHALAAHLGPARLWLDDLRTDIEGFADARFEAPEARALHDGDLEAARGELGARLVDLEEKQALHTDMQAALRRGLHEQLLQDSRAYRELVERSRELAAAAEAGASVLRKQAELHEALEAAHREAETLQELDDDASSFPRAFDRLQRELDEARETTGRAQLEMERAEAPLGEAHAQVREARDLVEALQRDLQQKAEDAGLVEADPAAGFDDSALRHAEAALRDAEGRAEQARAPHARAEAAHREALQAFERLEQRRTRLQEEESRRVQKRAVAEEAWERAWRQARDRAGALEESLAPYLRHSRALVRLSALPRLADPLLSLVDADRAMRGGDASETARSALERSERLRDEAEQEQEALAAEHGDAQAEQARLFAAHAEQLLGSERITVLGDA